MAQTNAREDSTRGSVAIRRIQTHPNLTDYPTARTPSVSNMSISNAESDIDLVDSCSEADSAISMSFNRDSRGSFASLNGQTEVSGCASPTSGNRFHILNREQVSRLCNVMEHEICINAQSFCSSSQLPTIKFTLKEFLRKLQTKIKSRNLPVTNIRLNGGAATFVIFEADYTKSYNDVDLIFDVSVADESVLEEAKRLVFETLFEFVTSSNATTTTTTTTEPSSNEIESNKNNSNQQSTNQTEPAESSTESEAGVTEGLPCTNDPLTTGAKVNSHAFSEIATEKSSQPSNAQVQCRSFLTAVKEAYVKKMIRILNDQDRWSLISLSNDSGRNLEVKFVEKIRRQFEFTVDSFHIILDSLLRFYESGKQMTEHYYPTIAAESVYGNFGEAFEHLQSRTIFTRNPEEIRGGGLLRFCRLLSEGYHCASELDVQHVQQLMCSRFFIDFSTIIEQEAKLRGYLDSHFPGDDNKLAKHRYLNILYQVVAGSTICLMAHEMHQVLSLIFCLANQVIAEIQQGKMLQYMQDQLANLHVGNWQAHALATIQRSRHPHAPSFYSTTKYNDVGQTNGDGPGIAENMKQCYDVGETQNHSYSVPTSPTIVTVQHRHTYNGFGGACTGNYAYNTFKVRHSTGPLQQQRSLSNYDNLTGCSTRHVGRRVVWRTSQSMMTIKAQPHYFGGHGFQTSTQVIYGNGPIFRDASPCI